VDAEFPDYLLTHHGDEFSEGDSGVGAEAVRLHGGLKMGQRSRKEVITCVQ